MENYTIIRDYKEELRKMRTTNKYLRTNLYHARSNQNESLINQYENQIEINNNRTKFIIEELKKYEQ